MKKYLCGLITAIGLVACTPKQPQLPAEVEEQYNQANQQILILQQKLKNPDQFTTCEGTREVWNLVNDLSFNVDTTGLDSVNAAKCIELQTQIAEFKVLVADFMEQTRQEQVVIMFDDEQKLLEQTADYPIYLERGDNLFISVNAEKPTDITIYNANSPQKIKTYSGTTTIYDSLPIHFKAIYLIRVNPKTTQYTDIKISYRAGNLDRFLSPRRVTMEQVEGKAGDFLAESIKGIKMQNLFEEPRKFTLRGQLKAAFSGSYRGVVAIQVPSGASDILYSLRISTNEGDRYSDGKFHDNMETSYKRVKMLGLPVYESHNGSGLIATLLGENAPVREEDAYINLYVFYDAGQSRKFQDGGDPAKIKYNIDYSKMGTQSCNDRIPTRGYKTVYLGFLNERMRYNNYVWLEAVSAIPSTEYFKPQFTLEE